MSWDEVAVAVHIGLVEDPDDVLDDYPVRQVVRPAGSWGIFRPGLRRAGPFDGLLGALA